MSYLDTLKANISVKSRPTLLTKPTQAPSVSFVSTTWCHVLQNKQAVLSQNGNPQTMEEDTPIQYWSDVLQERLWVAPTQELTAALSVQGQAVYMPEEIWLLRDLKAHDPEGFPAKLHAIHQAKTVFGATVFALEHQTKTQ